MKTKILDWVAPHFFRFAMWFEHQCILSCVERGDYPQAEERIARQLRYRKMWQEIKAIQTMEKAK